MFWGSLGRPGGHRGLEFEHVLRDIQTLNVWASEGRLEATAISLHTYPFVQERYVILPHGASMGTGAGPVVVSREPLAPELLRQTEIAVPGSLTTAFLLLRLFLGDEFRYREVPSDQVLEEVRSGRARAGLVIGAGQLAYEAEGLQLVVDLGEWWLLETGLRFRFASTLPERIWAGSRFTTFPRFSASQSQPASVTGGGRSPTSRDRGRGLDEALADRFVGLYVSERTEDYGDEGREAVRELLARGERVGAFEPVHVEFVS